MKYTITIISIIIVMVITWCNPGHPLVNFAHAIRYRGLVSTVGAQSAMHASTRAQESSARTKNPQRRLGVVFHCVEGLCRRSTALISSKHLRTIKT